MEKLTSTPRPSDLLTVKQVAAATHYTEEHIRRLAREQKLRAFKPGRKYLIPRAAFDEYFTGSALSEEERLDAIIGELVAHATPLSPERKSRLRELLP